MTWVKVGTAVALVLSIVALSAVLYFIYLPKPSPLPPPPVPKIVVVPIDFALDRPQVDWLVQNLTKLSQRDDVVGLILLVNSPGGTVSATEMLYSTLLSINKTKYTVVAGLAASGAYYISVATEKIYASPSSWVGSIGVIAIMWPENYFYEIPDYLYTTGPLKYYGRELLDYYNDVEKIRINFVNAVLKGRGEKIKTDPRIFETAAMFTAVEALQLGLIDEVGSVLDAAREMAEKLNLKNYSLVYLGDLARDGGRKLDVKTLLSRETIPMLYILPTAIEWNFQMDNVKNVTDAKPRDSMGKPYVVLDMAHQNLIPSSFLEVLRAELATVGYALLPATTEYELSELLKNASGCIIVNPVTPFSKTGVSAVVNATKRGVKVLYFYDMRASGVIAIGLWRYVVPYSAIAPYDPLLMYFNMSGLRSVYNYTTGATTHIENWQFVIVHPNNWSLLNGVSKLVLFSPSAVSTNAPHKLEVAGYVFGYGEGIYTVAAQVGNFTFVGSVRSFTPYFITLGDNSKFFKNLVSWLTS